MNLLILSCDLVSIFALKVDTDLIIDERDDHAIVERNEGRRLMVLHLSLALHEDEGTVGGGLVLARFRDEPTLGSLISDVAVVSRYGLQLDLNFTLH